MEPSASDYSAVRRWVLVIGGGVAGFAVAINASGSPGAPLPLYGPMILADAPAGYPSDPTSTFGPQGLLRLEEGCLIISAETDAVAVWPSSSSWDAVDQAAATTRGTYEVGSRVALNGVRETADSAEWRTAFGDRTVQLIELCQDVTGATDVAVVRD